MSRERPILFSAPMVGAILEGRKTVTRRVVKSIPWRPGVNPNFSQARAFSNGGEFRIAGSEEMTTGFRCPYGKPGDRLYVRETSFRMPHPADVGLTPDDMPLTWQAACDVAGQVLYRADMESRTAALIMSDGECWTPSIHMPKDRARIWLEVTAVRVERLRNITAKQAIAEGMRSNLREHDAVESLRNDFAQLWNGLAKTGSRWDDNPWVWVVEFRRVEGGGHANQG